MPLRFSVRALSVACALAIAPAAIADPLIEVLPGPDPGTTFVQVNGTDRGDVIQLGTLCNGDILVVRLSGCSLDAGVIDASLVATNVIVVQGGAGCDVIDTTGVDASATLEVHGGDGDDLIVDGPGSNLLMGEGGNDVIYGGDGDDTIIGGPGRFDALFGGNGNDNLLDEDGVDVALGGAGDDTISINFAATWDNDNNPYNVRKSIGRITGGDGNDEMDITILGAPLLLVVNGDSALPSPGAGAFDILNITGPLAPGSSYSNFEFPTITP